MVDVEPDLAASASYGGRNSGKPLRHIHEQILQASHLCCLAAHAAYGATLAAGSLLTLEAKHLGIHSFVLSCALSDHPLYGPFRYVFVDLMTTGRAILLPAQHFYKRGQDGHRGAGSRHTTFQGHLPERAAGHGRLP